MSVLILESLDETDPGSEGQFLTYMLNLMGVENQYLEIRTPEQFVTFLTVSQKDTSIVHITTHGSLTKGDLSFSGFWTPSGVVTVDDLGNARVDLRRKVVISTACKSGTQAFSRKFLDVTRCKHYIAPRKKPKYHNAIMFAHVFYHKHLILERPVREAFDEYEMRYANPHNFRLTSRFSAARAAGR